MSHDSRKNSQVGSWKWIGTYTGLDAPEGFCKWKQFLPKEHDFPSHASKMLLLEKKIVPQEQHWGNQRYALAGRNYQKSPLLLSTEILHGIQITIWFMSMLIKYDYTGRNPQGLVGWISPSPTISFPPPPYLGALIVFSPFLLLQPYFYLLALFSFSPTLLLTPST